MTGLNKSNNMHLLMQLKLEQNLIKAKIHICKIIH